MSRLAPQFPFPPYTYVPGQNAHPMSSPDGHRMQGFSPVTVRLVASDWASCDAYCFGFDLLNAGYWWEAHEVWESCWHAVGRQGLVADYLKGLIKLAASLVKAAEGNATGVLRHGKRAEQLLREVQSQVVDSSGGNTRPSHQFAGCDLAELILFAQQLQQHSDTIVRQPPRQLDLGPLHEAHG